MSPRILARRYPLNSGHNMWLEVGVALLPEPHVEIALIDKQMKEIQLSEEAFEKLNDERECILRYLFDNNPSHKSDILHLGEVAVKFSTVEENSSICFHVSDIDITILRNTCQNLLRLHEAIKSKVVELKTVLPMVKSQLRAFVHIVRNLDNRNRAYEAITSSPKFHKTVQMDNELVTLALADIVKLALPEIILDIEQKFPLAE